MPVSPPGRRISLVRAATGHTAETGCLGNIAVPSPGHERLEELFSAALRKDTGAGRNAFLDDACGDDVDLRSQLRQLLNAHDSASSFLDSPPVDPDATVEVHELTEVTGTKIGRYKILQEIGEGGFGSVYMAEQEEPVRRMVAVKVIKLGMDTKQVIARFEAERQALALMDHPNIARVLDAGATESGRPYFVMELVKGINITEYCDKHRLATQERLQLFIAVCHAVQHAHQKGVIHRDLKPSNVLVTLHDGTPVPKVIDFGIAKATSQRLTEKTLFTEFRQFLGTPEYMSPDQADISGLDVDTRTDIYSLGVLLYELLTGTTPFDGQRLRGASFEEIRRTIRDVEPPTPSARLQTTNATQNGVNIARLRQTEPVALWRRVRGDLDWVAMKAMEKDRTRRYATAKDLADDVERHLRLEPVQAGPPGVTYKAGKFVKRHRIGVMAGLLVCIALITGLAFATAGFIEARRARSALELERDGAELARANEQHQRTLAEASAGEARKQAAKSVTLSRFLQEMLGSVDPGKALGREVTVRFILDEASRKIDEGALANQLEVEAAVRLTLGETYKALGLYAAAEKHVGAAQGILTNILGDEHPDTLRSNRALAELLRVRGGFAQTESLLRRTADTQLRVLGEDHPDTLTTMNELALALWGPGRFEEAESIHRRTLELQRRVLGEEHIDTVESIVYLGAVCRSLGKTAEAESLLREGLDSSRRLFGEEHPCTTMAMNYLGMLLEGRRDYAEAERLFRRTYEVDRRVLGPDHPRTLMPMNNLLRVLNLQGKTERALPLVAERLAHLKRAAKQPEAGALALHAYAWELLTCESADLRDPLAALPTAARAVKLDGGRDAGFLETLALAYQMTGDLQQAIGTQRLAVARAELGGPYNVAELEERLVDYMLEKRDFFGAAGVSWEGLAAQVGGSIAPSFAPGASMIARSETLIKEDRFAEAADLLQGCLDIRQKALPEGHWMIADTLSRLGGALTGDGRFTEAEPLLLGGYESMHGNLRAPADSKREAVDRIVSLYEYWGKPGQAAEWRSLSEDSPAGRLGMP